MRVVEAAGLARTYPGPGPGVGPRGQAVVALRRADLVVPEGKMVVVTGPSGSGKTTLLMLLGTIDRPDPGGSLRLFGEDVGRWSAAALARLRRERIGIVFQDAWMVPGLSTWENVALPLLPTGLGHGRRRERALSLLASLGLEGRADARAETLSGGERSRVAIARSLVGSPRLLLADEPTAHLDPASRKAVAALFGEFVARGGTVILTVHDGGWEGPEDVRLRLREGTLEDPPPWF